MPDGGDTTLGQIERLVPLADRFPWATYSVVATLAIVGLVIVFLRRDKEHRADLAAANEKVTKMALEGREHSIRLVVVLESFMRFFEQVQWKVTAFTAKQKKEP